MTALVAARILNGDGGTSASPAWLVAGDGRIVATGTGPAPDDAVDLGDALLAPGFVDIQVNGAGAVDFAAATVDEMIAAIDARVAGGCTACLPTICTAPLDAYAPVLERLAAVRAARPETVLGVHLEGPFLGGAPGAHPVDLVRPVDLGLAHRPVRPLRRPRAARHARARGRPGTRRDRDAARARRHRRDRAQHGRLRRCPSGR